MVITAQGNKNFDVTVSSEDQSNGQNAKAKGPRINKLELCIPYNAIKISHERIQARKL